MTVVAAALLCVLAGSFVYCLLALLAVRNYLAQPEATGAPGEPLSVLKPLAGCDAGLEENLRSFFEQQYDGDFELLFAVRTPDDPAAALVTRLRSEYSAVSSSLIVTGEPPWPNAKVWSLDRMLASARYELLVMSDSDIRVDRGFLTRIASEFADGRYGLATCPYRAVGGPGIWSALEAAGMNTEFLAGVLTARMLEGVRFTVGPTVVARRRVLDDLGGFAAVKDYLAEDFMLGRLAAERGHQVILSRQIVEHRIGDEPWRANAAHRLRWARSTRRSRPAGYTGQLFTNPLPIAAAVIVLQPSWWPVLIPALALRALLAWATAGTVLKAPVRWGLVAAQDFVSLAFWFAGFFGNTILWRGRRYHLRPDGTFVPVTAREADKGLTAAQP